jgi:hypothetical protein
MRLGYLWQRAHTLRRYAETLQAPNRDTAIRYARRAKSEFTDLAKQTQQSLPSIAVLDEEFAALDGDCAAALGATRSLDLASLDPQDLYITSFALKTCGEHEKAAAARAKIEASRNLELFNAIYRYLIRHE